MMRLEVGDVSEGKSKVKRKWNGERRVEPSVTFMKKRQNLAL